MGPDPRGMGRSNLSPSMRATVPAAGMNVEGFRRTATAVPATSASTSAAATPTTTRRPDRPPGRACDARSRRSNPSPASTGEGRASSSTPMTSNRVHVPGTPFSSNAPRSMISNRAPATRSLTVCVMSTSAAPACPITRAPVCTTIPWASLPLVSISPKCTPPRISNPSSCTRRAETNAHRTASAGPSNTAQKSRLPAVSTSRPRCLQLLADHAPLSLQQPGPSDIAQLPGQLRGPDHVGEQHGAKDRRSGLRHGASLLPHRTDAKSWVAQPDASAGPRLAGYAVRRHARMRRRVGTIHEGERYAKENEVSPDDRDRDRVDGRRGGVQQERRFRRQRVGERQRLARRARSSARYRTRPGSTTRASTRRPTPAC